VGQLVATCQIDSMGFATKAELLAAPHERVVAATVVNRWLAQEGDPHARELGRFILGLGLE
jgi:hypothetical protein